MDSLLTWLYVVAAALVLFGASIFVHEWGHYWVARRRGLVVQEFAIGFGPRLFGWTDREGVTWSLRALPLGGFVKLPQMVTSEALEGAAAPGVPPASPWSRILVSFAGPVMNVVFAFAIGAIIWRVGLPVALNHTFIGYVDPKSPEAASGIGEGDRVVSVGGRKVRNWEDIQTTAILALTNVLAVEIAHADGRRGTYPLTTEVSPGLGLKVLRLEPRDHPVISEVSPGSAAQAAGLKRGDEFRRFAGVGVVGHQQLIKLIQKRPQQPSEVEVLRGGSNLVLTVTPVFDATNQIGRIGVVLGSSAKATYTVERPGPTPWAQVAGSVLRWRDTLRAILHRRQSGVGFDSMSGPVGIFGMLAGELNVDFRRALAFLVMLNVNLALLNLLPLPVLDGGHILMALYELVTRRRVSLRFLEVTTTAFALVLLSFMLYVTFNDVTKRFGLLRSHLRQEAVVEPAPVPATSPTPAPAE
jgi:regulator of sigma E protease